MEIDCGGKLEGNDVLYNIYNYMQSELTQYDTISLTTPPKTNMEPKNEGLEDAFSFQRGTLTESDISSAKPMDSFYLNRDELCLPFWVCLTPWHGCCFTSEKRGMESLILWF